LALIAALIEPSPDLGARVQRKVFRIEQMAGKGRAQPQAARATEATPNAAARELARIRETIAHSKRELMALQGSAAEPRMTRAAYELGAAIDGMEKATQKILKCSEAIDESAKTLAVTLKTPFNIGLAQDIQEQTIRIYEACNFQDLAGQRVAKAIAALQAVEEHVTRMTALWDNAAVPSRPASAAHAPRLVNGPKLDGDSGHITQSDIDAMFG
jgi:chemotaxis protein CheZ